MSFVVIVGCGDTMNVSTKKGKQQSMALCHLKTVKSVRATGLYDGFLTSHINIIYEKHKPAFVHTQILSVFA